LNDNFEVDEFPEDIVKTSNFKSWRQIEVSFMTFRNDDFTASVDTC
jgi:hypothetical protein